VLGNHARGTSPAGWAWSTRRRTLRSHRVWYCARWFRGIRVWQANSRRVRKHPSGGSPPRAIVAVAVCARRDDDAPTALVREGDEPRGSCAERTHATIMPGGRPRTRIRFVCPDARASAMRRRADLAAAAAACADGRAHAETVAGGRRGRRARTGRRALGRTSALRGRVQGRSCYSARGWAPRRRAGAAPRSSSRCQPGLAWRGNASRWAGSRGTDVEAPSIDTARDRGSALRSRHAPRRVPGC